MSEFHVSVPHFVVIFCISVLHQLYRKIRGPSVRIEKDVRDKVVVITGASAGLGKSTAEEMAKRGAIVIMTCRDMKKGSEAQQEILKHTGSQKTELVHLDLSDLSSIRKCASHISSKYPVIDILINNAGIAMNSPAIQLTEAGHELHFATNHLGHFLLTRLLLPNLQNSEAGRIVTVSSSALFLANLSIDDLSMSNLGMGIGNFAPYSNSKFANALFNKELGKQLSNSRVNSFAICPGLVKTNLSQSYYSGHTIQNSIVKCVMSIFGFSVEQGTDGILWCALSKGIEHNSGKMYRFGTLLTSVESVLTNSLATELWDASEKLVFLNDSKK